MSRQNVGKPRFYIDYIQYWNARGLLKGIGKLSGTAANADTLSVGNSFYMPHLLGLNPSNYNNATRMTNYNVTGFTDYYVAQWGISLNKLTHLPDTNRMFISCLKSVSFSMILISITPPLT